MPNELVGGAFYDWISYDFDNQLVPSKVTGAPDEKRNFHKPARNLWCGILLSSTCIATGHRFCTARSKRFIANKLDFRLKATFNNIDAGLRFKLFDDRIDGEITLYRLQGQDEVLSYTKPDNTREPRNAGQTLHQGIEIGGTWKISDIYNQRLKTFRQFCQA